MQRFVDLTLNGLSNGAVYAAVALSLVLIWRATRILNFAQAGMLMFTTFIAWTAIDHGASYWVGFAIALMSGLVLGAIVERVIIRHVEGAPPLNAIIVTLGVFIVVEGLAGMFFGGTPHRYPTHFSNVNYDVGDVSALAPFDLFTVLVVAAVMAGVILLFTRTTLGLRMRAAAFAPEVARLVGVRVGNMFTVGWALASVAGSLAGVLVAPSVFVAPNTFDAILVFGFTAAVIGGLESPVGALVGGTVLGLALSYVSGYWGAELVTLGALVILIAVLMVRPSGLFTRTQARRV